MQAQKTAMIPCWILRMSMHLPRLLWRQLPTCMSSGQPQALSAQECQPHLSLAQGSKRCEERCEASHKCPKGVNKVCLLPTTSQQGPAEPPKLPPDFYPT